METKGNKGPSRAAPPLNLHFENTAINRQPASNELTELKELGPPDRNRS